MSVIDDLPKLRYGPGSRAFPHGSEIETIIAEPWYKIDDFWQLEGLIADREGRYLYFVDVFGGGVHRIELATKQYSRVYGPADFEIGSVKIHKDGRLFLCAMGNASGVKGGVYAIQPDGGDFETIVDPSEGFVVDDIVFDSQGGFYFTDFKGFATQNEGGVYYVPPEYNRVIRILGNMAIPNGIALRTDGSALWITESCYNRILHVYLAEDGASVPPSGATVACTLSGNLGPDSCCVDSDDNLYVAIYGQGRFLVLNRNGFPIGEVRLPEADDGKMLRTTSIAFAKDSDRMFLCSNDGPGGIGSCIYSARGYAKGHNTFQYQ
ncbi:MAG: SMP-30/gluconolactonase/LRE family protein [Clostridiales Family XIII bacterium]|jgi:lactonase|nr:SMP-30/gluconolactonase/LRE family protein [Clostridiales Family XIII bacterium]